MAHFNPQMCEPSCCVNCAGRIILDEDNCTLCWETSGDVVRAELWRMDDPPVLVAELLAGCICNPTPGDYELRVFCQVGDGEVTLVVDEDTVPGDWDCAELCGCSEVIGKQATIVITGTGGFAPLSGTYVFTAGNYLDLGVYIAFGIYERLSELNYCTLNFLWSCSQGRLSFMGVIGRTEAVNYGLACSYSHIHESEFEIGTHPFKFTAAPLQILTYVNPFPQPPPGPGCPSNGTLKIQFEISP